MDNSKHQPLYATPDDSGALVLGYEIHRWPMQRNCDASMPAEDRERIATVLETHGVEGDVSRGYFHCVICQAGLDETEREIEGDALANTKALRWPAEALAHYVRSHGLVIDHRLLHERFGIAKDGTRPAIVHSGHHG